MVFYIKTIKILFDFYKKPSYLLYLEKQSNSCAKHLQNRDLNKIYVRIFFFIKFKLK